MTIIFHQPVHHIKWYKQKTSSLNFLLSRLMSAFNSLGYEQQTLLSQISPKNVFFPHNKQLRSFRMARKNMLIFATVICMIAPDSFGSK